MFKPRNYHLYNAQISQLPVRSILHELENMSYITPQI